MSEFSALTESIQSMNDKLDNLNTGIFNIYLYSNLFIFMHVKVLLGRIILYCVSMSIVYIYFIKV